MERGEVLELPVVGCNRGGALVAWNGLQGFVPASHLVDLSPSADEGERQGELRRLVGTRLCLKIIEVDSQLRRFVLSERASRLDESRRQDLLDQLCPGDICRGHVTNLCSFGAFVDLGGLEGLVHVSELSWGRVDHPSDVLGPGDPVEVYVLNVDRERRRVGLSVKRLQPDPWQSVEERYHVGQVIEGIVTHVVDFGAFARVEDGLEGLIHVSELAEGNFIHPRNVVQEGDVVAARVLSIDSERRRMGLSMRQVDLIR
jgi:small subunit ribosomal protein S1